jgi:hypothetical protein
MFLVILDKFDLNHVLINVNKLKPYQILNEKAQTTYQPESFYWER